MTLPRRVVAAYSFISLGLASSLVMIGLYLPRLYVDHVGVPLSRMALVLLLTQIWDAATELPIGILSDRTKSNKGRRRPFVLIGSFVLAVVAIGLFAPPRGLSMDMLTVYVLALSFVCALCITIVRTPWMAWGAELTSDYNDKTVLVGARELVWVAGYISAVVVPAIIGAFVVGLFERLLCAAVFWACVISTAGIFAYFQVPDPRPTSSSQARSECNSTVAKFAVNFARNRLAVALHAAHNLLSVAVLINGLLYAFYVPYILEVEATEWIIGLYIIAAVFGNLGAQWLSKRVEKKPVLVGGIMLQASLLTVVFFAVGSGDVGLYVACLVLAGFAFGGSPPMLFSVMNDIVDVQQLISGGFRDEAKIYGLFDITRKLGASTGVAICFAAIDNAGYQPDVKPQSVQTKLVIRVCYALVPAILMWMSAGIIGLLYSLNRKSHAEVLAKLAVLHHSGGMKVPKECEGQVPQECEGDAIEAPNGCEEIQSPGTE